MTRQRIEIDLEILREQIIDGMTADELAEEYGVSTKTIHRRSADLGLRQQLYENIELKFHKERREMIKSLCIQYGSSFTMLQLQEKVGISSETISPIVAELIESGEIEWSAECETCDETMTVYYSTGRFCSAFCARSYASSKVSEEGRKKQADALRKISPEDRKRALEASRKSPDSPLHPDYWTLERREDQSKRTKQLMENPEIRRRISEASKAFHRDRSEEDKREWKEKLSQANLRNVENGTHIGWTSRNVISYPEQSWMNALDRAGIEYFHNYRVSKFPLDGTMGSYFLDFMIRNDRGECLDFEVDGKQHEYPERKAHDALRDENLTAAGYTIYRAKWYVHNNADMIEEERQKAEDYLSKFLGRPVHISFDSVKDL